MDSPSFKGFHAQLDCKQDKAGQNRNDEKYSQSGITVKIHTNHDGVRATATATATATAEVQRG